MRCLSMLHAAKPKAVPSESDVTGTDRERQHSKEDDPQAEAVPLVLLDVGGMKCGGCSAAVKRMLAARPDVESAAVNLITETAAVRFRCTHDRNDRVRPLQHHAWTHACPNRSPSWKEQLLTDGARERA